MNKLDEFIRGYVWPKSKLEGQGESLEDGSETSTDVRRQDMDSEERTREEIGYGGNEEDGCVVTKPEKIRK